MNPLPPETVEHLYPVLLIITALVVGQVGVVGGLWRLFRWLLGQIDERIGAALHVDKLKPIITPIVAEAVGRNFEYINRSVMDLKGEATRAADSAAAAHRRLDVIGAPRTVP